MKDLTRGPIAGHLVYMAVPMSATRHLPARGLSDRATILLFICLFLASLAFADERPRIFVLTDIENEPDDA